MTKSTDIAIMLNDTSRNCLTQFTGGQDAMLRFVWCCVDKIFLCTQSLNQLLPLVEANDDIEFSVGIILRSMLMDSILIQRVGSIVPELRDQGETDMTKLKERVYAVCNRYIADGTSHLIELLGSVEDVPEETRKELCKNIASTFPEVFDITGEKPVRKPGVKNVKIKNEYEAIYSRNKIHEIIYTGYNVYSKYDHVSHWSSEFRKFPKDARLHRLEGCLTMILVSLRELMLLPVLFSDQHREFAAGVCKDIDTFLEEQSKIE
jgi:hypothetical protein